MRKLGVSTIRKNTPDLLEQPAMIKDAGFDCCFPLLHDTLDLAAFRKEADRVGLEIETVHLPFSKTGDVNLLWEDSPAGDAMLEFHCGRVEAVARAGVGIAVMHTSIGDIAPEIGPVGLDRFRRLADHAEKLGVRLAFENLEPLPHLHAVMEAIGAPHGFCWDCGHNLCYTPAVDMMEKYGERLICTHIHDNHGVTRPGHANYRDDLHQLPFDGVLDWAWVAETIRNSGYQGPLTFELSYRPEYQETPFPAFLQEAYRRAEKFRKMVEQEEE